MDKKLETHILNLSCKDQVGIVAKISSILAESNCNIVESKQFTDQKNGNFFIRKSFLLINDEILPNLKKNLEVLAKKLNADFFQFNISGMDEGLQFTNYKSPSDRYDKHIDRCYNAKVRKLSISIQLTDPNNYEGGELYIYDNLLF